MATLKAKQATAPKLMSGDGDGYTHVDTYSAAANFTGGDTIDYLIPAGSTVHTVQVQADQLDTNGSPTAAFRLGYQPVDASSGLAANTTYFAAAGQTLLRTGGRLQCSFKPIKFDEDVWIRMTVNAACATFAAGDIQVIAGVNCDGIK